MAGARLMSVYPDMQKLFCRNALACRRLARGRDRVWAIRGGPANRRLRPVKVGRVRKTWSRSWGPEGGAKMVGGGSLFIDTAANRLNP
jgi:hypothetical protein